MAVHAQAARSLTIGSRGSPLALWQANYIARKLNALGCETRIEIVKTTGDRLQTASLVQAGGKGLFTKELEDALLSGAIDIAVHSLKDLPTTGPNGLVIAAIPEREDPRDAILGGRLRDLPERARVGTSSGRRAAQLRVLRTNLNIQSIRGNIDTRVRKWKEGQYEAIVLAVAGLRRLGLSGDIAEVFAPAQICPAPGQGALAVQTREDDPAREICAQLNHERTMQAVACERATLQALGGGCQTPVGVYGEVAGESLHVLGVVLSSDGSSHVRAERNGTRQRPEELGRALAGDLLARGAAAILAEVR